MSLRKRFAVVAAAALIAVIGTGVILLATFHRLVADGRATAAGLKPDSAGAKQLADLASLADWYAILLVATTALLLLIVGIMTFGLNRDVLAPLRRLRRELAVVTGGRLQQPISTWGPQEIAEVGSDAEAMRRSLVIEIDRARAFQDGLAQDRPLVAAINAELATPTDSAAPGYVVRGTRHAAEGVISGDWWDAVTLSGGRTAVLVADATGHGPVAGISALRVKTASRMLLADGVGPAAVMAQLDRVFQDSDGRFVTLFIAVLDPAAGTLTWANAGHEPALLRKRDGTYAELGTTGPLLSRLSGGWQEHTVDFGPGDVLIALSDGLVDLRDPVGAPLTTAGVRDFVDAAVALHGARADAVAPHVEAAARERTTSWDTDDVTLVVVSVPLA